MPIRFLLFSGNWENEGNFYLLETKEIIIILAAGKGFSTSPVNIQEQQIGHDYLKENKNKVRAIILNNTRWQNIGLIAEITKYLNPSVPIYASRFSKLILLSYFFYLKERIRIVEEKEELKLGDFSCFFCPLSSHSIGNLAVKINYQSQYSFFFMEGFVSNSLLDDELLFPPNFLERFYKFLTQKKTKTYLITSFNGIHWRSDNSLFFATRNFSHLENSLFFILYDHDWLHIIELLKLAENWGKKVHIFNKRFSLLIKEVLPKSFLDKVISEEYQGENVIYLLVSNPESIQRSLENILSHYFSSKKKANLHFVVGVPPVMGGEERLARIIDYLYTQSSKVTNLSKKEYLSLGTSFYDFKLLLHMLKPNEVITLQNSYKNEKFFPYLLGKFSSINNGYSWDLPARKISLLKTKKTLINLEELLVRQRESLGQTGMMIILLLTEWEKGKLQLKDIKIETIALGSLISISKLEKKIKNWWENKIVYDIKRDEQPKTIKKIIERRLNDRLSSSLNSEYNIDLANLLVLLFDYKHKKKNPNPES